MRISVREKVIDWGLFDIPVRRKDPVIVWEHIARNLSDVVDDLAAFVSRCCKVNGKLLLAVLLECGDLWHVGVVKDVECLGHQIGMGPLRQGSSVWVTYERGLQVECDIRLLKQLIRESRDILAGVTFTSHVERLACNLWEGIVDVLHQLDELGSS